MGPGTAPRGYCGTFPALQNAYLATTRLYHSWYNPYVELSNTLAYNYVSDTVNHSFLCLQEYTSSTHRDNLWKASLSISYYFSVGKDYEGTRFLENEDSDRGGL